MTALFLPDVEEVLAARIIATAKVIAPCLDTLEGDDRATAIAILRGVARDAPTSRNIRSERTLTASVDYATVDSWFTADDRAALRALCGASSNTPGPVGRFPKPAAVTTGMYPETYED